MIAHFWPRFELDPEIEKPRLSAGFWLSVSSEPFKPTIRFSNGARRVNSSKSKSTMTRWLLILPGWTIACGMVYAGALNLEVAWNLFSWRGPRLDPAFIVVAILSVAGIGCLLGLAKHLNTVEFQIATALPPAILTVHAAFSLREYFIQILGTAMFARTTYSPLWFHLLIAGDLVMPAFIWLVFVIRNVRMRSRLKPATFNASSNATGNLDVQNRLKAAEPSIPHQAPGANLVCPSCQRPNPKTFRFCAQCGKALGRF